MISVIIPVYNVENYIDRCLKSVVNQTFKDIEIIIINDGSTDATLEKCIEWQKKDARIKIISQENQGQGPARQAGIQSSKGQYIAFVDADDWIDPSTFEKTYSRIVEMDADVVLFDYYCVKTNNKDQVICYERFDNQCDIKTVTSLEQDYSLLYKISGVLWDMLWKKSCFDAFEIPNHPYEDEYTVGILLSRVKKIAQIKEHLYYYNVQRIGNTTHSENSVTGLEQSFIKIRDYYKEHQSYDTILEMLRIKAIYIYRVLLCNLYEVYPYDKVKEYEQRAITYLETEFPQNHTTCTSDFILFGSYNLRIIMKKIVGSNEQIDDYAMSSIVSAWQDKNNAATQFDTSNPYQQKMLQRDYGGSFYKSLKKLQNTGKSYLVIDFLEEIRGLVEYDNQYYTYGKELELTLNGKKYRRISFLDDEFLKIWTELIDSLVLQLKKSFQSNQILIIENYLNTRKVEIGDLRYARFSEDEQYKLLMTDTYEIPVMKKQIGETLYSSSDSLNRGYFGQQDIITAYNQRLKYMYDYFSSQIEGIKVVKINAHYMGTDLYFPLGVTPEYYNEAYYLQAAEQFKIQSKYCDRRSKWEN